MPSGISVFSLTKERSSLIWSPDTTSSVSVFHSLAILFDSLTIWSAVRFISRLADALPYIWSLANSGRPSLTSLSLSSSINFTSFFFFFSSSSLSFFLSGFIFSTSYPLIFIFGFGGSFSGSNLNSFLDSFDKTSYWENALRLSASLRFL